MNIIMKVSDWIAGLDSSELVEMRVNMNDQLAYYDKANTGIGFIMALVPMVLDTGEDDDPKMEMQIKSFPVYKVRGEWYTITDENISDILSSIIRTIHPTE